jgi:hypothetical protein
MIFETPIPTLDTVLTEYSYESNGIHTDRTPSSACISLEENFKYHDTHRLRVAGCGDQTSFFVELMYEALSMCS